MIVCEGRGAGLLLLLCLLIFIFWRGARREGEGLPTHNPALCGVGAGTPFRLSSCTEYITSRGWL